MINRITTITNEALKQRWSTVAVLTALLTGGKAYSIQDSLRVDLGGYLAQVFLALIISFVVAIAIHVALYLIFSPKKQAEAIIIDEKKAQTIVVRTKKNRKKVAKKAATTSARKKKK